MNKILRFKEIIENTKNINTCMKALNYDIDSCFLIFFNILMDAILHYIESNSYEYLINTSNYLIKIFDILPLKKQKEYNDLIYKLRKVYKRQIQNIDINNQKYFDFTFHKLNDLITDIESKNNINVNKDLNRERQTGEYIITIDDDDAKILDDGLSITKLANGNLLFKVHIADPLVIYPYESKIMKNAKLGINNAETIDLISNEICYEKLSLKKGKDRYAKSFCFEFDEKGNIVNFYITNSIIKVDERHSYNSINKLYRKGGRNTYEDNLLTYYDELVKYLRIMFKNVRDYEEIKDKKLILEEEKISSFSERLITYSMVLTGYMTAKYMNERELPFVYRCNKIAVISEDMKQGLSKKQISNLETFLSKSFYTPNNVGHEKLQIDTYSHVTSPLRRYIDDINMHALNICYFNKPNDKDIYSLQDEIKNICDLVNKQNNNLDEQTKMLIK